MKGWKDKFRYRLFYRMLHAVSPLVLKKYDFQTDKLKDFQGPYLVMSNHLTEVDMFILAAAFPKPMFFVAGEHLLRSKNGPFMKWAQDPIFEFKGSVALDTAREILDRLKKGKNVILFPEGSRSFNGETLTLPESAAKLVKLAGCGLVTYHMEGGYFVAPRWAYTFRTGPMRGRIAGTYTPQQIRQMSTRELTEAINRDLAENAYQRQRGTMAAYRGERLAEGLENYLVKCSRCGAFDSMKTEGDRFRCLACGQSGVYTEQGFLKGEGLRFDSVYDWGKWSEQETEAYIAAFEGEGPVFQDEDLLLYEITADHQQKDLVRGSLSGFKDRLEFAGERFDLQDIPLVDMLYYGKTLLFSCHGRHLGITGEAFHAIKYAKLHKVFKEKERE